MHYIFQGLWLECLSDNEFKDKRKIELNVSKIGYLFEGYFNHNSEKLENRRWAIFMLGSK